MEFHIKLEFLHKHFEMRKAEEKDGFTAIEKALKRLDSLEKDNIKSVSITYMK